MPVEEHAVHKKVSIKANKPYGCHNKDRLMTGYNAPNRAAGTDGYKPTWWLERVRIPHVMSKECRYDMSLKDARCEGCNHAGSGERYAAMVSAKGA